MTAAELKECLKGKEWDLGIPDPDTKVKCGKSKCFDCQLPTIIVDPPEIEPGDLVTVYGENFAPASETIFMLYAPDMSSIDLYSIFTSEIGTFEVTFEIPFVPSILHVQDSDGYWTWHVFHGTPPTAPEIEGSNSGKPGIEYDYTFTSTDPDIDLGDQVYFYIDWGDGDVEAWKGPYNPGQPTTFTHSWDEKGEYLIKARAKDKCDDKSDWSEIEVNIPRSKTIYNHDILGLFSHFNNLFPILRLLLQRLV